MSINGENVVSKLAEHLLVEISRELNGAYVSSLNVHITPQRKANVRATLKYYASVEMQS